MFSLVCNGGRVYLSNSIWIWKITVQLHCSSCELIAKWMQFYQGWAMQMFFYWHSPDKQSASEWAYVIILIPRAIFSSVCGKKCWVAYIYIGYVSINHKTENWQLQTEWGHYAWPLHSDKLYWYTTLDLWDLMQCPIKWTEYGTMQL